MKTRDLTCIVCPRGCSLQVLLSDDKEVLEVRGNFCKRGQIYGTNECTNPQRTVTSTVRMKDGRVLPVKTDRPIPKEKVFACMEIINRCVVDHSAAIGDVLVKDVFGSNIVATANMDLPV